jgi:hypothetical protein
MLGAFDKINRNFTEVEVYQQEFAGDENIKDTSIDLVASVLYAIEMVVGFFVSKTCSSSNCYHSFNERRRICPWLLTVFYQTSELFEPHSRSMSTATRLTKA